MVADSEVVLVLVVVGLVVVDCTVVSVVGRVNIGLVSTYESGAVVPSCGSGFGDDLAFPCNPCSIASRCGSSARGTDVSSVRALMSFMPFMSFSFGPGFNVTGLVAS